MTGPKPKSKVVAEDEGGEFVVRRFGLELREEDSVRIRCRTNLRPREEDSVEVISDTQEYVPLRHVQQSHP